MRADKGVSEMTFEAAMTVVLLISTAVFGLPVLYVFLAERFGW